MDIPNEVDGSEDLELKSVGERKDSVLVFWGLGHCAQNDCWHLQSFACKFIVFS